MHHDLPVMGHPGIYKTLVLTRKNFWWPGMASFITSFVQGCATCQQMKVNTHPTASPLNPISADPQAYPFSTVMMDFIIELPESDGGYDSLMVVVDHNISKGVILIPYQKTIDAITTARLYHENVYRRFGLPK